jgi:hypothetical protein
VKAGTAEGGTLQALLGLLINQGVKQGSVRKRYAVRCCRYNIWCADKARPTVYSVEINHVRGGHVHFYLACWCLCTWPMGPFSAHTHVSSTLNNESTLCAASLLQAVAAFDGMVVTCNGCDKEFADTSGRSKHSRKMNCGDYKRRASRNDVSKTEQPVHKAKVRRQPLAWSLVSFLGTSL